MTKNLEAAVEELSLRYSTFDGYSIRSISSEVVNPWISDQVYYGDTWDE